MDSPDDEILATFDAPLPPISQANAALDVPIGWEKLLVDAAVIGGRDRWARRLRGLRAELQTQLRNLEEEDESRRTQIGRRIQQLERLEHFALPLIDALSSLPSAEKWGVWLDRLMDLAQMALRHPESVFSVLAELEPMRDVGPASLEEVYDVLSERLGSLRTEPPKRRYGRVFVGSIEEARGRSFDVVFLPGLAEGLFPRRAFEDPLLLDEHRIKLTCRTWKHRTVRVARERMLLRSAAAAAAQSLVVSYPRMDVTQSRARVPSFYALEVVRAAEGRLPSLREFEKRAARAASSRLDWPAPANPRDAIDDAEYDLASLQAALKLRGAAGAGSARYLMQANASLARSLRTRGRRWRNCWSDADGIVDPDPATLEALEPHRLRQSQLFAIRRSSISPPAPIASCCRRFFNFARARSPRRWNKWTRSLAARFSTPRNSNCSANWRQRRSRHALLDLADQVLDRVAARYEDELAPAIPRVWKSEIENLRTDLRGWLQHVAATKPDWLPAHFRVRLRPPARSQSRPASTGQEAVILDGIRLRGSIDLIERHATNRMLCASPITKPANRPKTVRNTSEAAASFSLCSMRSPPKHYWANPSNPAASFIAPSAATFPTSTSAQRRIARTPPPRSRNHRPLHRRRISAGRSANRRLRASAITAPSAAPMKKPRVKRKPADRLDPLIEIRHSP